MPYTTTEAAILAAVTLTAPILGWWIARREIAADQRRAQAEIAPRLAKLDRDLAAIKAEAAELDRNTLELQAALIRAAGDRAERAGLQASELTKQIQRERLERQLAETGRAIAARRRLAAAGKAGR
jgi:hypothetical protein